MKAWVTQLVHFWNPKTEMSCHLYISGGWQNWTMLSKSKKDIYRRWSLVHVSGLEFGYVSVAFSTEMNECEKCKTQPLQLWSWAYQKGKLDQLGRIGNHGEHPNQGIKEGLSMHWRHGRRRAMQADSQPDWISSFSLDRCPPLTQAFSSQATSG